MKIKEGCVILTKLIDKLNEHWIAKANQPILKDAQNREWLTGSQARHRIDKIKDEFKTIGITTGAVVTISLPNDINYPLVNQALWELGAIGHLVAPSTALIEIEREVNEYGYFGAITLVNRPTTNVTNCWRETTIVNKKWSIFINHKHIKNMVMSGTELDTALILNTSGTTGKPKRVALSHQQLLKSAQHIVTSQKLTSQETTMVVMPLFHINATVISTLATFVSGGNLVITDKFSASKFWSQVAEHHVTWISLVPTIISILLLNEQARNEYGKEKNKLQLRYVRSASFSLPEERWHAFEQMFGIPVIEGYGMTEAASLITLNPFNHPKIGSVGIPVATEVQLMVDGKLTNESGMTGEIALKGDHVITSYLDPAPHAFADKWLLTGDVGRFDTEGYLYIIGRVKEMINRGGEKVSPYAIESIISVLPFIEEVIAVGLPHDLYGEEVALAIITRDKETPHIKLKNQIENYATQNLSKPERPTKIFFVHDVPRNPTGKVKRFELVKQLLQQS